MWPEQYFCLIALWQHCCIVLVQNFIFFSIFAGVKPVFVDIQPPICLHVVLFQDPVTVLLQISFIWCSTFWSSTKFSSRDGFLFSRSTRDSSIFFRSISQPQARLNQDYFFSRVLLYYFVVAALWNVARIWLRILSDLPLLGVFSIFLCMGNVFWSTTTMSLASRSNGSLFHPPEQHYRDSSLFCLSHDFAGRVYHQIITLLYVFSDKPLFCGWCMVFDLLKLCSWAKPESVELLVLLYFSYHERPFPFPRIFSTLW